MCIHHQVLRAIRSEAEAEVLTRQIARTFRDVYRLFRVFMNIILSEYNQGPVDTSYDVARVGWTLTDS